MSESPTPPHNNAGPTPYGENPHAYGAPSNFGQTNPGGNQPPTYAQGTTGYGQQPGYYPQGGYAYPGPGQAMEHPSASTVFLLGIIGIFFTICAYIAWFMGAQAKKQIESGAPYRWDGNLKTGYMLGKVFSIISIVLLVLMTLLIVGGVLSATSSIQ